MTSVLARSTRAESRPRQETDNGATPAMSILTSTFIGNKATGQNVAWEMRGTTVSAAAFITARTRL